MTDDHRAGEPPDDYRGEEQATDGRNETMHGSYVFRVRFRLDPEGVEVSPNEFETVVRLPAPVPGEDGWRFFEQWLWHGALTDERRFRDVVEQWLSVPVSSVRFSELAADRAYLDAWETAVGAEVDRYNADSVREVRHQHLGSSVRIVDDDL